MGSLPEAVERREIEVKLAAPDPEVLGLAQLSAALGDGFRLVPRGRVAMADVYCDTAAFDLLRAGLAFRVRGAPDGVQVTLKSLERTGYDELLTRRLELEGPVADPTRPLDAAGWPEDVRRRILEAVGTAPKLVPYCVLGQARDMFRARRAADPAAEQDDALAEISVDRVTVYAPGAGSRPGVAGMLAAGEAVGGFGELEMELLPDADEEALLQMAKRLAKSLGLGKSQGSKLEQALALLADHAGEDPSAPGAGRVSAHPGAGPAPAGIWPPMAMSEAGRLIWRRQLTVMLLTEAGARRGEDIEYVHDMRVATRRARAAAQLFGPYFKPKAIESIVKGLRRTARALGAVRDLDVALAKLQKHAQDLPAAERDSLAELAAEWRVQRRHSYRELQEWLDGAAYRRFVAELAVFCRTPGRGARRVATKRHKTPQPYQVRHVMPSAILERFEQVRSYEAHFERPDAVPVPLLHALRIDCKRLRYVLEPVEHLLGKEGSQLVSQLKQLQDLLGDLNDASFTRDRLLAMRAAGLPPAGLDAYIAHQEAAESELAAAAPSAFGAFISKENRRLLALAIARL